MQLLADHRIEFVCTDDEDLKIPPIINPSYIYKIGDRIKVVDLLNELDNKDIYNEIEVVDIKHELTVGISSDQSVIIYVKKIDSS